jgi:CheY-like chemotaxis protein
VTEDDNAVRAIISLTLSNRGFTVIEAAGGFEALQKCEAHKGPIHLLVTDLMMPKMGGRELANHLSLLRPGLEVLYMSGHTEETVTTRGSLEVGMHFIQKPFTMEKLTTTIREILDQV